jgi:hypothetical protein
MEELDQSSLHPLVNTPICFSDPSTITGSSGKYSTEELASQWLIELFGTFRVLCFRWIHLPLHAVQGVQPEPERGVVPQAYWRLDIVVGVHHLTSVVDTYLFRFRIQFFPQCGADPDRHPGSQINADPSGYGSCSNFAVTKVEFLHERFKLCKQKIMKHAFVS